MKKEYCYIIVKDYYPDNGRDKEELIQGVFTTVEAARKHCDSIQQCIIKIKLNKFDGTERYFTRDEYEYPLTEQTLT